MWNVTHNRQAACPGSADRLRGQYADSFTLVHQAYRRARVNDHRHGAERPLRLSQQANGLPRIRADATAELSSINIGQKRSSITVCAGTSNFFGTGAAECHQPQTPTQQVPPETETTRRSLTGSFGGESQFPVVRQRAQSCIRDTILCHRPPDEGQVKPEFAVFKAVSDRPFFGQPWVELKYSRTVRRFL